jgi:hypothetical protein
MKLRPLKNPLFTLLMVAGAEILRRGYRPSSELALSEAKG